ncbi:hypothetical protein PMAYCL1PPCAC_25051, partial [Pristionchus mayeri]
GTLQIVPTDSCTSDLLTMLAFEIKSGIEDAIQTTCACSVQVVERDHVPVGEILAAAEGVGVLAARVQQHEASQTAFKVFCCGARVRAGP